ncbi:hypothetical protein GCM10009758_28920 [Microbacterium hatanonis]
MHAEKVRTVTEARNRIVPRRCQTEVRASPRASVTATVVMYSAHRPAHSATANRARTITARPGRACIAGWVRAVFARSRRRGRFAGEVRERPEADRVMAA